MKVFLSWSGQKSKEVADTLGPWIRQVIQAAEPWISSDIEKGARWQTEIANRLEEARIGIVCLTRDNLDERWILFEAGALAKTKDAHVCTFLLDVTPADVKQPLSQFQHTQFQKDDVRRLIGTINEEVKAVGERALDVKDIDEIFELFWPRLDAALNAVAKRDVAQQPLRSEHEILLEILEIVRSEQRRAEHRSWEKTLQRSAFLHDLGHLPADSKGLSWTAWTAYMRLLDECRSAAESPDGDSTMPQEPKEPHVQS